MVARRSGSTLVSVNEVNLRRARVSTGMDDRVGVKFPVLGRGHAFVGTSQRRMTPCGWGVKTGMVRVWVVGKTV